MFFFVRLWNHFHKSWSHSITLNQLTHIVPNLRDLNRPTGYINPAKPRMSLKCTLALKNFIKSPFQHDKSHQNPSPRGNSLSGSFSREIGFLGPDHTLTRTHIHSHVRKHFQQTDKTSFVSPRLPKAPINTPQIWPNRLRRRHPGQNQQPDWITSHRRRRRRRGWV